MNRLDPILWQPGVLRGSHLSTTTAVSSDILDEAFGDLGLSEAETRRIYRDNAIDFYRLQL